MNLKNIAMFETLSKREAEANGCRFEGHAFAVSDFKCDFCDKLEKQFTSGEEINGDYERVKLSEGYWCNFTTEDNKQFSFAISTTYYPLFSEFIEKIKNGDLIYLSLEYVTGDEIPSLHHISELKLEKGLSYYGFRK